jgi:hypothetical protein
MNEPLTRVLLALTGLSLLAKGAIGLAIGLVLLVIILAAFGWSERRADARFDKEEAARNVERVADAKVRADAIAKAEAAEQRAAVAEAKVEIQMKIAESQARGVSIADAKTEEHVNDMAQEIARAGDLTGDVRDAYIRAKLRALGIVHR